MCAYPTRLTTRLDFKEQRYSAFCPNLHAYPATMLPLIGIELFKQFKVQKTKILDPYCGTGSSFVAGLHCGFTRCYGNDLNPLATTITKAKLTRIDPDKLRTAVSQLKQTSATVTEDVQFPTLTNASFWYSPAVLLELAKFYTALKEVECVSTRRLCSLALTTTARKCSYQRDSEFKQYRMPADKCKTWQPDVKTIFAQELQRILEVYLTHYLPLLTDSKRFIFTEKFKPRPEFFEVCLTSPPYGDSSTTVAYGQFSRFANEWLDVSDAKKIDSRGMGGNQNCVNMVSSEVLQEILATLTPLNAKRAQKVQSFYHDLAASIADVAVSCNSGAYSFYVVGNRRVCGMQLPTDQFVAEQFEQHNFKHITTLVRALSGKSIAPKNDKTTTMTQEFIVVCRKF